MHLSMHEWRNAHNRACFSVLCRRSVRGHHQKCRVAMADPNSSDDGLDALLESALNQGITSLLWIVHVFWAVIFPSMPP